MDLNETLKTCVVLAVVLAILKVSGGSIELPLAAQPGHPAISTISAK